MPIHECAPLDNQRVTGGIPSLSPEKRRDVTEAQLRYIYQKACQNEYRKNEQTALAPDGSMEDVTDWDQIVGIPLEGWKVCARLKRLNPNLWFEPSKAAPDQTGIYLLKNDFKGGQTKEFLCGIPTEICPEFALRVVNPDGSPKGIVPGWRRALMRLIRARVISESAAYSIFGPPSRDSENWALFAQ
jgi:hypothetical protein